MLRTCGMLRLAGWAMLWAVGAWVGGASSLHGGLAAQESGGRGAAAKPDPAASPAVGEGDEGAAEKAPAGAAAKFRGRLPAYYSRFVNREQRAEIYSLQKKYFEMMEELRQRLDDLVAERDAKVRGVLTEEQAEQIDTLTEAARSRRRAPPSASEPPASEPPAAANTEGSGGS